MWKIHDMAEVQELLTSTGAQDRHLREARSGQKRLQPSSAARNLFGKGQCAACHMPPHYTGNTMHNLQVDRFYRPEMITLALGAKLTPTEKQDLPQFLRAL